MQTEASLGTKGIVDTWDFQLWGYGYIDRSSGYIEMQLRIWQNSDSVDVE